VGYKKPVAGCQFSVLSLFFRREKSRWGWPSSALALGTRLATALLRFRCVHREEARGKAALHPNPVRRGLVSTPQEWLWSSFRHYAYGEPGPVLVNEAQKAELQIRKIS